MDICTTGVCSRRVLNEMMRSCASERSIIPSQPYETIVTEKVLQCVST